jgi:hypothetical protein
MCIVEEADDPTVDSGGKKSPRAYSWDHLLPFGANIEGAHCLVDLNCHRYLPLQYR